MGLRVYLAAIASPREIGAVCTQPITRPTTLSAHLLRTPTVSLSRVHAAELSYASVGAYERIEYRGPRERARE